ncbi:MAG: DNA-protecting protein DprA [Alphaproteobacteria bacterium]|nr:DNA-protecting protein DprA [Alphaproteobacteria bacterium]
MEATDRSGSLITARLAGEQGRDVMAVPGHPLDPRAQAPNRLIRDGATLIRSTDDVLEAIRSFSGSAPPPGLSDVPQLVYDQDDTVFFPGDEGEDSNDLSAEALLESLSFTPTPIDGMIRQAGGNAKIIQTLLMELELAGRVQRLPGGRISRIES